MQFATSIISSPLQLLRSAFFSTSVVCDHQLQSQESLTPSRVDSTPFNPTDFEVDPDFGFLPSSAPLTRLGPEYDLWEDALACANAELSLGEDQSPLALSKRDSSARWRESLRSAPILSTQSLLDDTPSLQRAHHVLAFLVHFFVHSIPPTTPRTAIHIPASLAVPLVQVSRKLDIAPVLTFADTVLWNWKLVDPSLPFSWTNIRSQTLFTGTKDEENFYSCCASIEMRGVEALRVISEYQDLPLDDPKAISRISASLSRVATVIDDLTKVLQSVRCHCEPHTFYFAIRPWFRGSDAGGPDSPGWIYEGVENSSDLLLSGPSAGQSSMIHALDVFFDVDHQLEKPRLPAPSDQNKRADRTFMNRMRRYMPGKHQAFLLHLASSPRSIRDLAQRTPALREPYDSCILALKRFRDAHLRIACLYVVSMSRSKVALKAGCPVGAMMAKMEEEEALAKAQQASSGPTRGTGGNELSSLLKACRDATTRTLLSGPNSGER